MIRGKKSKIIEVSITSGMALSALDKSEEMGVLRNSITEGKRNLLAFVGEEVANSYLKGEICNTYDYDLIVGDVKIDVKSKDTTVYPKEGYEVSVANFNIKQKCDYYVFVRVLDDMTKGWILGYMPKDEYFEKARFLKKGEIDGTNGFAVRADCWNMFISDLKPIKELYDRLQGISQNGEVV